MGPKGFWHPDNGMICALDHAFMSTSTNRQTPIEYMASGPDNVLWEISSGAPCDFAYRCGANISRLSQFAAEDEVLFPPCTLLVAKRLKDDSEPLVRSRPSIMHL